MPDASARRASGGRVRVVAVAAGVAVLVLIARPLVAMTALPLAALVAASRPRMHAEFLTCGAAAGLAGYWLLLAGDLPDQVARSAALLATFVFVAATLLTRLSFTHRALFATAGAAVGVALQLAAVGVAFRELRWWVAHRTGYAARWLVGDLWSRTAPAADSTLADTQPAAGQIEELFLDVVPAIADYYPALLALELFVAFAIALAIYHRVARLPRGLPLGRFRDFRFSEHLGWVPAVALLVILLPKLAAAQLAATNVLIVAAALYALRGLAVVAFGLQTVAGGGVFLVVLSAIILFFLLPIVLAGALVLGVVDAGFNLRRRWAPTHRP